MDAYLPGQNGAAPGHGTTSREFSMDAWSKKPFRRGTPPLYGRSISIFDATDKKWKKTWVDSQDPTWTSSADLKMAR